MRIVVGMLIVALAVVFRPALLPAQDSKVEQGKTIFQAHCARCHLADSIVTAQGPGLQGLFKRDKLPSGREPSEENIRDQIQGGGDSMPPFRLPEDELNALIQYLKTL